MPATAHLAATQCCPLASTPCMCHTPSTSRMVPCRVWVGGQQETKVNREPTCAHHGQPTPHQWLSTAGLNRLSSSSLSSVPTAAAPSTMRPLRATASAWPAACCFLSTQTARQLPSPSTHLVLCISCFQQALPLVLPHAGAHAALQRPQQPSRAQLVRRHVGSSQQAAKGGTRGAVA